MRRHVCLFLPLPRWSAQELNLDDDDHEVLSASLVSDPEGVEAEEDQGVDMETDVDAPEPSEPLDRNQRLASWIRTFLVFIRALESAAVYDRPVVRGLSLLLVGAPAGGRAIVLAGSNQPGRD